MFVGGGGGGTSLLPFDHLDAAVSSLVVLVQQSRFLSLSLLSSLLPPSVPSSALPSSVPSSSVPSSSSSSSLPLPSELPNHAPHRHRQSHPLHSTQPVPEDVYASDESRDLPGEADDGAGQRSELGDGEEDEDLAESAGEAEGEEEEAHLVDHPYELGNLVRDDEKDAREDGLACLNVVHEVERSDVLHRHKLVLVRARSSVEAEGHEEESDAGEASAARRVGLGGAGAAGHEEGDAGDYQADAQVLSERVPLAESRAEEHHGDGLAGLGQDLDGVDHVPERRHGAVRGAH